MNLNLKLDYPTNRNPAQSLKENATAVFGPLKNSYSSPAMPNYDTAVRINSILDQQSQISIP